MGERLPARHLLLPRKAAGAAARVGGSYAPLRPTPNIVSAGALGDYVDVLEPLVSSLYDDAKEQIVYQDPKALEQQAADLTADVFAPVREKLLQEATVLRARIAKRSSAAVAAEQSWAADYRSFLRRWQLAADHVADLKKQVPIALTTGSDWTELEGLDLEYQKHRDAFAALGGKPSRQLPPAPSAAVPWKGVLLVGGLVAGAVILTQVRSLFRSAA